jgi:hypothetical protein
MKMPVDLHPDSQPKKGRTKAKKSQLKVVLDTNALYVTSNKIGSASDLVREEIANLISEPKHADLEILWHLPEIVRHERQYQMQTEALRLRSAINRIERLLGHNLALTDQILLDHVRTKIEAKRQELGLLEIKLDCSGVDWPRIIQAAVYRKAPFETGEKEKGFRDALVAESFLQLLAASPRTPNLCRVVLVTSDGLLTRAVNERIADSPNASVLANVEELKGLINTIVSNVGEEFIAQIKPKATKLFFVSSDNKKTIFYAQDVRQKLTDKFSSELETRPEGTGFRKNGKWLIDEPNFSRKVGRRTFWTSRIEIEVEAGKVTRNDPPKAVIPLSSLGGTAIVTQEIDWQPSINTQASTIGYSQTLEDYLARPAPDNLYTSLGGDAYSVLPSDKRVTHKGTDVYEVLWSTAVTPSKDLTKPVIEDITHVELNCQPIL